MTRARGLALQKTWAEYVRPWWPKSSSTPNGVGGTDVRNTPGIFWEVKTPRRFDPFVWVKSAADRIRAGELPICVFFPERVGEKRPELAIGMVPAPILMLLLERAGYTELTPLATTVETKKPAHPKGLPF